MPDTSTDAGFWDKISTMIDKRVNVALDEFGRNYHPRGSAMLPLVMGIPGTPITPVPATEWAHLYCNFGLKITDVEIGADAPGRGTFNILIAPPGQTLADAFTIFGAAAQITLDDGAGGPARQQTLYPESDWTTMVPAGSWLLPYCLTASGLAVVTINLNGKCT